MSVCVGTATSVKNDFFSDLIGSVHNFNGCFGGLVVTVLPSLVDDAAKRVFSGRCPDTTIER
jgi:hypothetical protein